MTRRQLYRRLRARLDRDDRGFTIIETMVAIVVVFGSLTALLYAATAGFRYVAIARDRITATAYANKVIEETRALAYAEIKQGLSSDDLSSDIGVNIDSCAVVYCFEGERLVVSSFPDGRDTSPLYPHVATDTFDGLEVTRRVYVTSGDDDPLTEDEAPYTVTVIVSWVGAPSDLSNMVRLQSDFYSPTGCVSSATHPYAAPCQPFFYGEADVPRGQITFEGSFYGDYVDLDSGGLSLPFLSASVQQEQTTTTNVNLTEPAVSFVDSMGTEEYGGETNLTATDTDPSTDDVGTTGGYSEQLADEAYVDRYESTANNYVGIYAGAWNGDRYQASATAQATGAETYSCPVGTTTTAENDGLPCSSGRLQVLNNRVIRLDLSEHYLGEANLARVTAPSTSYSSTSSYWWKATIDRDLSSEDGRIDAYASRYLGKIRLGGLPSDAYGLQSSGDPIVTDISSDSNYCLRIQGPSATPSIIGATVAASAGYSPTSTTSTQTGDIVYYDQATNAFKTVSITDASLSSLAITCQRSGYAPDGEFMTWRVTVSAGDITPATTTATPQTDLTDPSSGTQEAIATATPPTITFRYELLLGTALKPEVDLTVTVDLGELLAKATYGPPPPRG